jgi:hypothetical protein
MKLVQPEPVVTATMKMRYSENTILGLGIVLLASTDRKATAMKQFLRAVQVDAISPRGRKPRRVVIAPCDLRVLRWVATAPTLPHYQARRAKIVLAIAAGARTQQVAKELGCDEATVWRICRRYEQYGLTGLLADGRRPA